MGQTPPFTPCSVLLSFTNFTLQDLGGPRSLTANCLNIVYSSIAWGRLDDTVKGLWRQIIGSNPSCTANQAYDLCGFLKPFFPSFFILICFVYKRKNMNEHAYPLVHSRNAFGWTGIRSSSILCMPGTQLLKASPVPSRVCTSRSWILPCSLEAILTTK